MSGRLAVFDCDGTLVDGQGAVCRAMEAAYGAAALPCPDRATIRRMVGLSLPQAVRRLSPGLSADAVHALVARYKDAFRAARASGELSEPLYDGIPALLESLGAAGWLMGVATGKSDRGLTSCLATHAISGHFITLQTADRHPSKPHPAMLEAALDEAAVEAGAAVMIGDTAYDMAMAVNAGERPVGVAWGYHEAAELRAAGAVYVAGTVRELQEYLLDG